MPGLAFALGAVLIVLPVLALVLVLALRPLVLSVLSVLLVLQTRPAGVVMATLAAVAVAVGIVIAIAIVLASPVLLSSTPVAMLPNHPKRAWKRPALVQFKIRRGLLVWLGYRLVARACCR